MRVGSLCTGYGGLEMGLKAAFGEIDLRFVSDIDKDASTLLAHHHPDIPNLGDLTAVDWEQQDQIDVLTAGYPCQPFSVAGFRKGEEDERAIFNYISDAVSVLRPRYLLFENVSGHLTLGGAGVISELTRLRYDCRWGIISAAETGAAHQRKRLFIWCETTHTSSKRYGGGENAGTVADSIRQMEGETQQQRTRQQPKYRSAETTSDSASVGLQELRSELRLEEKIGETRTFNSFGPYEPAIRRWETVINRPAPIPVDEKGVNPVFVEWMMGLPEGWVTDLGLSRTAELKMLGNGVVPQQAHLALQILTEGGVYA